MSKKIFISGNTINGFNSFTLCCTKDFDNKFFTNNSSLVDNEEYFYADFKSVETIESCYENKIINLQDKITKLEKEIKNRLNYQKDLRKINNELEFELNDTKQLVKDLKRKYNQDKIEFCIEKLEKLVEKTLLFIITNEAPWKTMRCVNAEKIENLIEELKEKWNDNQRKIERID